MKLESLETFIVGREARRPTAFHVRFVFFVFFGIVVVADALPRMVHWDDGRRFASRFVLVVRVLVEIEIGSPGVSFYFGCGGWGKRPGASLWFPRLVRLHVVPKAKHDGDSSSVFLIRRRDVRSSRDHAVKIITVKDDDATVARVHEPSSRGE